jgi:hypothetical protein
MEKQSKDLLPKKDQKQRPRFINDLVIQYGKNYNPVPSSFDASDVIYDAVVNAFKKTGAFMAATYNVLMGNFFDKSSPDSLYENNKDIVSSDTDIYKEYTIDRK